MLAARLLLAASLLAAAGAAMAIETPRHQVVERRDGYEVREYAGFVVAETEVEASQADAGNEGFRRLAGFIFGKNDGGRKLEMTAPVTQAPGTKLEMTAPVTQAAAAEWARYDPPWMPWFLRTNEIQVPLTPAAAP